MEIEDDHVDEQLACMENAKDLLPIYLFRTLEYKIEE
jgi:hypothetical protein